ncbi:MAG: hypothetical protein Q9169_008635 [Polycauliona sp. 2 TL-2023]
MPSSQQPSEYITLISNDGFEFVILREAACVAGTIKRMLDPASVILVNSSNHPSIPHLPFPPTLYPPLPPSPLPSPIPSNTPPSGVIMEKLSEYLYYNLKHRDSKDVPDMDIPPALCLELLVAADYFDV